MKNVVLARVDDRLIHGEVVSVWTPSLNVNRIIVVDDEVAADKFNTTAIPVIAGQAVEMTAPTGTTIMFSSIHIMEILEMLRTL